MSKTVRGVCISRLEPGWLISVHATKANGVKTGIQNKICCHPSVYPSKNIPIGCQLERFFCVGGGQIVSARASCGRVDKDIRF